MVSITATPVYCVPGTLSHYCGAYSWGPQWSSRRVEFWYDNEMVAAVLTLAPLEILTLMVPMHFLALLAVCHSFPFKASSVHAKANPVADTLSRFQFQRFRHLALQAENADPSPPPPHLRISSQSYLSHDRLVPFLPHPGLAPSTRQVYLSAQRRYVYFCHQDDWLGPDGALLRADKQTLTHCNVVGG